ncbi:mavicyanin-like [Prunus avium]|uniref:Mavicyanin-like n=1 Tax=Prunus avium TaxID=42229 RepID=A0A6P5U3K2_PRUAV|nr:mavicyanin-like [Prunus avium]
MASSNLYSILVILAIFAPSILATDYVVGDDKGWTINFDYQAWAQGKLFYVGDNLVFNYPKGAHTVLKVNGTGFQQCASPLDSVPLTSGKDVINLATPGRKWYICGVGQHCELRNQKLVITVLPSSSSSAPSSGPSSWPSATAGPGPSTSAATTVGTRFALIMLLTIGFLWMLMA